MRTARPMTEHDPIPAEAWRWLDILFARLSAGRLTADNIPAPTERRGWSPTLDRLEEQLFGPEARANEPREQVEADRAAMRLARYVANDEPGALTRLLGAVANAPQTSVTTWR